jgi:uncharacterized protein (TIGR02145 family)
MKLKILLIFSLLFVGARAQSSLQFQLNKQGDGSCPGGSVELSVTTFVSLSTTAVSGITASSAISGGSITNDGGKPITQRGICYSTSQNPTTANNTTINGNGLGTFTSNLSGLLPNTTYYVRAYAINNSGAFYGNEINFTTSSLVNPTAHSCGAENVHNPNLTYGAMTDQEGNVYKTIVIGTQEWMAENLKTSIYRNGDPIENVTNDNEWSGLSTGAWCFYNNDSQYNCPYGKFYNWYAVTDPRNLCPAGWHVPTDNEWTILINYLNPNTNSSGNITNSVGGKLKSVGLQYWLDPNLGAVNESGFSGLPSGQRDAGGTFNFIGYFSLWSSSTESVNTYAWYRGLQYYDGNATRLMQAQQFGLSVRCLRD